MDVPMCATQHFLQEQLFFVLHLYYYFCYWMMMADSSTTLCLQIAFKSTKLCSRLHVQVHAVMSWMKVKRPGWRLKYLLIHLLLYIRIHSSSSNPYRQGDYVLTTESQSMLTSCVDTTKKEGRTGWLGHKCQSQPQPRHDAVGRFFASFTFPITISCACQSCFYTLALPLLCCSSSLVSTGFTFPSTAPCRPFFANPRPFIDIDIIRSPQTESQQPLG